MDDRRERDLDQGRMRILDAKPVNLDGFSVTNPELGLVAMHSPFDPEPALVIRDGVIVELDGKAVEDFDVIDEFIARYGLDLDVAEEAMALDDKALARLSADFNVPRAEVVRRGTRDVPETRHSRNLAKRFEAHGESYFRFVTEPGVEPTNNLAEQAIRFVVIDRLITQGTRGEAGNRWCERIWTVIARCVQQGRSVFASLEALGISPIGGLQNASASHAAAEVRVV